MVAQPEKQDNTERSATEGNMRKSLFFTIGTALIATTSFAQSSSEVVHEAREKAERASQVEGALSALEGDGGANRAGRESAATIVNAARAFAPVRLPGSPSEWAERGLDLAKAKAVGDRLVQTLDDGTKITFTVDPEIQTALESMLDNRNVAHGSVVLIDPPTGRVLAMASHTEHDTPLPNLARKSTAPSASVFKVITAAALIESGGIDPAKPVCYHGGRSSLTKTNIKGDKRRDTKCASLDAALAWSINSIMAKLAFNHLERDDLAEWAERFGYNQIIPFELPVEVSTAEFVDDPFERARSAAGFWHTYLSPLHGAMIGAMLANDGVMMQPSIIERVESRDGEVLKSFEPQVFREVMPAKTARLLGEYMQKTTESGTARKYFKHRNGFPADVVASGKTGTLSNKDPYLGFTWFVGYAERDGQAVGVAGLACNTPLWQIKGAYAASEGVRMFFKRQGRTLAAK